MTYLHIISILSIFTPLALFSQKNFEEKDTVFDVLDVNSFSFFYKLDSIEFSPAPLPYVTHLINLDTLNYIDFIRPYVCHQYDYDFAGPEDCNDTTYVYCFGIDEVSKDDYLFYSKSLLIGVEQGETVFIGIGLENDASFFEMDTIKFCNKTTLEDIQKIFPNSYNQIKHLSNSRGYWDSVISLHPHSFEYYSQHHWIRDEKYNWKNIWMESWQLYFKEGKLIAIKFHRGT